MTPEEQVSLGEILRRLSRMEAKLDTKVVYRDVYEAEKRAIEDRLHSRTEAVDKRVGEVEKDMTAVLDGQKWIRRTVIGNVLAVAGVVIGGLLLLLPKAL